MIYKIEKIKDREYKLNDSITLCLSDEITDSLEVKYDEKLLTEQEVNEIVNEFAKMLVSQILVNDSVKVLDGTTK